MTPESEWVQEIRSLRSADLSAELFRHFNRYQLVTKCWRKEEDRWVIRDIAFTEQWSDADYIHLLDSLRHTLSKGGWIGGAFENSRLIGFASVEGDSFGEQGEYLQLSNLHVSCESRRKGIGKALLGEAASWARQAGAGKLYISAHSAVESQAFYRAVGCTEAVWIHPGLAAAEPCDCQLEYDLQRSSSQHMRGRTP